MGARKIVLANHARLNKLLKVPLALACSQSLLTSTSFEYHVSSWCGKLTRLSLLNEIALLTVESSGYLNFANFVQNKTQLIFEVARNDRLNLLFEADVARFQSVED